MQEEMRDRRTSTRRRSTSEITEAGFSDVFLAIARWIDLQKVKKAVQYCAFSRFNKVVIESVAHRTELMSNIAAEARNIRERTSLRHRIESMRAPHDQQGACRS